MCGSSRIALILVTAVVGAGVLATVPAECTEVITTPEAKTAPSAAGGRDTGNAPPAPKLTSDFPHLVPEPPAGLTPEQERPWFDTFSWQEFIALNWPTEDGKRGVPKGPNDAAAFKAAFTPDAAGNYPQVVWGSWKQAYELFEQGSTRPTPWSSFGAVLPCPNPAPAPPKTFLDATNFDINESFSQPLIDQNKNYARYEIRLNETEYGFIRGQDGQPSSWLYLTTNLFKAPVTMPISTDNVMGAVEVKAAWKPMSTNDDPKRYYVVNALVLVNPQTRQAQYQKLGLVGFHIAHKTTPFTEWVWSTFEHVDNVAAPKGFKPSYNNGTPQPPTPSGFDQRPPAFNGTFLKSPTPVQVTRVNPIPKTPATFSTVDLNAAFQKLLSGTVWQNYQLIATQWPTKPAQFKLPKNGGKYPGDSGIPFPSAGVANTVIETYDQVATTLPTGNSCISCHYVTAFTDFSWVLAQRSHATITPPNQEQFLTRGRLDQNRALDAISKLGGADEAKAAPLRRALETIIDVRKQQREPK
jgi:hypothetical protein